MFMCSIYDHCYNHEIGLQNIGIRKSEFMAKLIILNVKGRDGFGLSPCGDEGYTLLINPYGAGVCTCQDGYILDQDQKCAKDTVFFVIHIFRKSRLRDMKVLKINWLYSFLHMYNTLHLVQLYTNMQTTEVLSSPPPPQKSKIF